MIISKYIIALIVVFFLTSLYPIRNYSLAAHIRALKKATFILVFSALPAGGAFLVIGKGSPILYGELFIYTASFLAPVFYWYYERANKGDDDDGKKIRGDWFTLVNTVIIFTLTAILFGAYKLGPEIFIEKYTSWAPLVLLGIAIILWYSILAFDEDTKDYLKKSKEEEVSFFDKVKS